MREKSAEEVYDEMIVEGMYKPADVDVDLINVKNFPPVYNRWLEADC